MPLKKYCLEKPSPWLIAFNASSATYPLVVPATMTTVLSFRASFMGGKNNNDLAISLLPAAGVSKNCFICRLPLSNTITPINKSFSFSGYMVNSSVILPFASRAFFRHLGQGIFEGTFYLCCPLHLNALTFCIKLVPGKLLYAPRYL